MGTMDTIFNRTATVVGLVLLALVAAALLWLAFKPEGAALPAGPAGTLHSVMLSNGQVYYGKLENVGHGSITLGDVHYVVTVQDQQGNRTNRLVNRRTNDWHGPTRMTVPADKIIMLEQVGPDSIVARGFAEEERNPQGAPVQAPAPAQPPTAAPPTNPAPASP
jgi:hypothetical protein